MMETRKPDLPELLAPAGSVDSLRAALAAGADAVYFGGTSFSNRMRAKNFGDSELTDAIRLCHSVGAAAHITVNTRVRDREMDEILRLADTLLNVGDPDASPDALIVADFGIAREIHRRYPEIALHASTQTSFASPADCRMLAEMGFTRLVIPRELSRAEIRRLCEQSPLEIEMFIHGAHCVSCSGQCLMSYTMGGRSGNRGECAQPCRLPFS
ncbi:MAG: U32 family peptidase, partial [Clostridia bacterium]|nr:U32 family peptidase [Clostridia bacterium]